MPELASGTARDSLISSAGGFVPPGNSKSTVMNCTHTTAMIPSGRAHFPSVNGPGTNLSLPDVILNKIGVE